MSKGSASSARGGRVERKARSTVRVGRIDFSDIPEASDEQGRAMRRVGRPPLGMATRQLTAIRVDPRVLSRVKKEARQRHVGDQTLINEILARYTRRRA